MSSASAVQIPLWTIVTSLPPRPGAIRQQSSDSSMDDCNTDAELILPVGKGSDSSMDDCNPPRGQFPTGHKPVQIPLWTIVTFADSTMRFEIESSDSSMDDCNHRRRLPGSPAQSSDSSMDDCNAHCADLVLTLQKVQIPLWTIVTGQGSGSGSGSGSFRFLYGRL